MELQFENVQKILALEPFFSFVVISLERFGMPMYVGKCMMM